jgi:transcription initiation factor TFIIE subunit alpha
MVKFNEQLEPLFALLKEVEDVKLSHSILEPEPTDIKAVTSR